MPNKAIISPQNAIRASVGGIAGSREAPALHSAGHFDSKVDNHTSTAASDRVFAQGDSSAAARITSNGTGNHWQPASTDNPHALPPIVSKGSGQRHTSNSNQSRPTRRTSFHTAAPQTEDFSKLLQHTITRRNSAVDTTRNKSDLRKVSKANLVDTPASGYLANMKAAEGSVVSRATTGKRTMNRLRRALADQVGLCLRWIDDALLFECCVSSCFSLTFYPIRCRVLQSAVCRAPYGGSGLALSFWLS